MPVYVITFESTHAAMAAEASLGAVSSSMIPTPRQISASCGMALRVEADGDAQASALFSALDVPSGLAALYREEPSESATAKTARYTLVQRAV